MRRASEERTSLSPPHARLAVTRLRVGVASELIGETTMVAAKHRLGLAERQPAEVEGERLDGARCVTFVVPPRFLRLGGQRQLEEVPAMQLVLADGSGIELDDAKWTTASPAVSPG